MYKNEVQVYNEFVKVTSDISCEGHIKKNLELDRIRNLCNGKGSFEIKMKSICDLLLDPKWNGKIYMSDLYWLPLNYRNYLNYLGPERIKANSYHESNLKKEMLSLRNGTQIKNSFLDEFIVSNRYTLKEIKDKIRTIYLTLKISKTPKATDILDYFVVRDVFIMDSITKKRSKGYEILKIKE